MTVRTDTMKRHLERARDADRRGDIALRRAYADNWRALATTAQAKRAPMVLRWTGRAFEERRWEKEARP